MAIKVTIEIPENYAKILSNKWTNVSRTLNQAIKAIESPNDLTQLQKDECVLKLDNTAPMLAYIHKAIRFELRKQNKS